MTKNYGETKILLYRKGPRLNTTNKKKEHTKKAPLKKKGVVKKKIWKTHTHALRVVMVKREVVLHKKCRKKNPFSTLLSSVSFFRPTQTTTTRTRTTLTTTTRIYISSSSTNGRPGAR